MITIGMMKNTHVDTSHSGKLAGWSSIAQNAESGIFSLAVYGREEAEENILIFRSSHDSNRPTHWRDIPQCELS